MATLTTEQIEQKKQQLKQLAEEVKALKDELVEAGAWPMEEDDLDNVAGGAKKTGIHNSLYTPHSAGLGIDQLNKSGINKT
jgi:hypothetical protein